MIAWRDEETGHLMITYRKSEVRGHWWKPWPTREQIAEAIRQLLRRESRANENPRRRTAGGGESGQ